MRYGRINMIIIRMNEVVFELQNKPQESLPVEYTLCHEKVLV